MGEYLGVGAGWQDIVRVLLLGNLRELVFPDRFGGRGWLRSWLNFPFFFLLLNLPFVFTVPWVDGGLAAAWFHFLYPYFLFSCCLDFLRAASRIWLRRKGGTFRIFCYGSLVCSGGFIYCAHSRLSLCFGAGGAWLAKHIWDSRERARVQSVVVCWCPQRRVGWSVRFVLGKAAGVLKRLVCSKAVVEYLGVVVGWVSPGFPRLLALALAPTGSAAFFCMPRY